MVIATGHFAVFDIDDQVTREIARIEFSMVVGGFRDLIASAQRTQKLGPIRRHSTNQV
jgi:hypothetical protein